MKKLVFFLAFMALAAVQANAQTVVLDLANSCCDGIATVVGDTYTVTPVSGAFKEGGAVSGCDGGGANCTVGFEFSYTVDASPFDPGGDTTLTTDKFSTEAAAFAVAQGTTFTALDTVAEFFACFGCSNLSGIITLEVALQQILGIVTPPVFDFTVDDLAQLSVDFSPCGDGGCDLTTLDDFSFDEFTFDLAACDAGACDALFETTESILETAFECTGPSCMEIDLARYVSELVESGMSETEAQQSSTEFAQALEQYLLDQIQQDLNVGREMDVEVPRDAFAAWSEGRFGPIDEQTGPTDEQYEAMEAYRRGMEVELPPDVEVPRDAFAAWTEGRFGPINEQTGPTDEQYEAMLAFEQLEGREAPSLDLRETTLLSPSGFTGASVFTEMFLMILDQDQQDMNIESVMPELADMVVL